MADTTDSTINAESGGDPNAQNPNSSASGPGQFIDSTFLSVLKAHHPDIAQGQTDQQLLAMKNDPVLGHQLTSDYASDNQAALKQAGLPVTPGSTYLAHFAGPGGAVKVMRADPNASAGDILGPAVVAANPFLKGMTAQGLQAWAAKRMGAQSPVTAPQNAAPGTPSAPPAAPLPQQQQPIFAAAAPAPAAAAPSIPTPIGQQPIFARQQAPNLSGLRAMLQARAQQQPTIFAGQAQS